MTPAWRRRLTWTGFFLPPAAWAVSLQTNYALVPLVCEGSVFIVSAVAACLVLVALAGGTLALRIVHIPLQAEWLDAAGGLPRRMIGWIGAGAGVLFALAIANQFAATLIVDRCMQ